MPLQLYNSLSRRSEVFTPLDPQRITVYLCGPTVYNYVHIGNARPAVVFDLLARLLRREYPRVVFARNITDVDDKINAAAQTAGVPIATITQRYAAAYREDVARLGVAVPDIEPCATAHIGPIVAMCERLIASGHAYAAAGHVLLGAVIGGALGHQVGHGRGNTAATIGGAVIGGAIGNNAGSGQQVENQTRCEQVGQVGEQRRIAGYDVEYRYRGDVYVSRLNYDPGERLRIRISVVPAD